MDATEERDRRLIHIAILLAMSQRTGSDQRYRQAVDEISDLWSYVPISELLRDCGDAMDRLGEEALTCPLRCRCDGLEIELCQRLWGGWIGIDGHGRIDWIDPEEDDVTLIDFQGAAVWSFGFCCDHGPINWKAAGF